MGQGSNRKVRLPSFQGSESHGEGISSIFQDLVMRLIPILFPELTFAASSSRNAPLLSLPDSTAPSVIWTRSVLQEAERMGSCLEETQPLRKRQRPKEPCGDARGDRGVDRRGSPWETKKGQERRERQSRAGGAPRKPEGLPDGESGQRKWCKSTLESRPEQSSVGFGG